MVVQFRTLDTLDWWGKGLRGLEYREERDVIGQTKKDFQMRGIVKVALLRVNFVSNDLREMHQPGRLFSTRGVTKNTKNKMDENYIETLLANERAEEPVVRPIPDASLVNTKSVCFRARRSTYMAIMLCILPSLPVEYLSQCICYSWYALMNPQCSEVDAGSNNGLEYGTPTFSA